MKIIRTNPAFLQVDHPIVEEHKNTGVMIQKIWVSSVAIPDEGIAIGDKVAIVIPVLQCIARKDINEYLVKFSDLQR